MKRLRRVSGTLRFIFIAVVLMLLADQFIFGGKRSYIEEARTIHAEQEPEPVPAPVVVPPVVEVEEPKPPEPVVIPDPPPEAVIEEPEVTKAPDTPIPDKEPFIVGEKPVIRGKAKIAIVIDDMGMDVKHSRQVMNLPAPVTLAFLPYAPKTRELASLAKTMGHNLIIHTPMEPMNGTLNIGPDGLKTGMSGEAFDAAFAKMLGSFEGYDGINNHMGSRLTQDKPAMDRLMGILKEKKLFFLDSKTIQSSVAAKEAAKAGVPYAERDVFLDHVETNSFVNNALAHAEKLAERRGYAILIGHPKDVTITALKAWIPTLQEKGIKLVPVKELLTRAKEEVVVEEPVAPVAVPEVTPEEPVLNQGLDLQIQPMPVEGTP